MNHSLYAVTPVALITLAMSFGCGAADDKDAPIGLGEGPAAGAAVSSDDPDARAIREQLDAYVGAIRADDAAAIEGVLSSELRGRIAQGSTSRGDGWATFVQRERRDVEQALGEAEQPDQGFSILALQRDESGDVEAHIAYGGRALPKPMHFVHEDGAYKLGVVPAGSRNYWVNNKDAVARQVACPSNGGMTIAPGGQATMSCSNTCGWWAKGSTFTAGNVSATCDYHNWTWDVEIIDNVPHCKDSC